MRLIRFEDYNEYGDKNCSLMFFHISKCSGTSINTYLAQHFGNRFFLPAIHYPAGLRRFLRFEPLLSTLDGASIALSGHYIFGLHEILRTIVPSSYDNVFYITFLRNPVERAKSMFCYHSMRVNTVRSFEDFLPVYKHQSNYMVYHLGGGSLSKAKEHLESDYFFFGTTELFLPSLTLLSKILRFDGPINIWDNASNECEDDFKFDHSDQLLEMNKEDSELYEWADKLLRRRLSEHGIDIDVYQKCDIHRADEKPISRILKRRTKSAASNVILSDDQLVEALRKKVSSGKGNTDDYCLLIALLTDRGETEGQEYGELCRKTNEKTGGAFFSQLIAYYKKQSPAVAINILREELALYDQYDSKYSTSFLSVFKWSYLLTLTDLYWAQGDLENGEECLRESWKHSNKDERAYALTVPAWRVLARLYTEQGRCHDAKRCEEYIQSLLDS